MRIWGWCRRWPQARTRSSPTLLPGQHRRRELLLFLESPSDRIHHYLQYESYILHEVMPLMAMKNNHPCTISHGCSFGAFHAVNLAFRHPTCSKSGRLEWPVRFDCRGGTFPGSVRRVLRRTYLLQYPSHFIPNLGDDRILYHLREMDIVLVVGDQDPFSTIPAT